MAAPFTVEDVVRGTGGALIGGDLGAPVAGMSIDSRSLKVGEVFFAICGHQLDGHRFLREAAARGASCLVIHSVPDDLPHTVATALVDDTTQALGRFAAWHRARFSLPVAGVTGSNGKTTTKEMMAAVLGALGPVLKSESSFNNQWGLPLTLLGLRSQHRAVALELGTNKPGEIATLAVMSRPTVGAVTMIASAHTEFLGSLDGVQAEKSALVRAIPSEGSVVLNADDPRVLAMRPLARGRIITVGTGAAVDVRSAGPVAETAGGFRMMLEIEGAQREVALRVAGRHNAINALVAAGVGHALGLGIDQIAGGLEAALPPKGRCVWRDAGPFRLLDDTYNANPPSVLAALQTFAAQAGARRRVVVLGDMLELGSISEEAHREAGRLVAGSGAAEFIGMGTHARTAVDAARAAGLAESHHTTTFEDTVALLLKRLAPGDALLVKGSRGMRMERVVDALMARFGHADD